MGCTTLKHLHRNIKTDHVFLLGKKTLQVCIHSYCENEMGGSLKLESKSWPLIFPVCTVKVNRWTTLMMFIHHCKGSIGFLHSGAFKGNVELFYFKEHN